jgi:hypothetical protein
MAGQVRRSDVMHRFKIQCLRFNGNGFTDLLIAPASFEHGTLNLERYPKVHRLRSGGFAPPFARNA